MSEIKVSVVCITYNHADFIRQTLDGFVMQKTNFDFEVIIHDDASTDGTAEIVREYAEKYPNIIKPIFQTPSPKPAAFLTLHNELVDLFHFILFFFCTLLGLATTNQLLPPWHFLCASH